jgi:hypothetical protein
MHLIETLERRLETEQSFFQAHLLGEDIARLGRMRELAREWARASSDAGAYLEKVMLLGWTAGDLRTHEIREPLAALAEAVYQWETGAGDATLQTRIEQAWVELHRARMERLVGCLSTPAPKPVT